MNYRIFYCCYSTEDRLDSDKAVRMDRGSIIETAMQVLRNHRDFVGVTDDDETTLQFMVEEDGSVWMEIPRPLEGGAYGKLIAITDVERILLGLGARIDRQAFPGMQFEKWP